MRRRKAAGGRRVRVPAGLGQPGDPDKGNPTGVPRREPDLERVVRRSNFTSWYPFYDWREYFGLIEGLTPGEQMLAELNANGNVLTFFDRVPANLTLGNIRQASQFPFPQDLYGFGLACKGAEVFDVSEEPGVSPFIGVDFRQLITEHTRLEITLRDATIIVNHWSGLFPPGLGVSGGVASTSTNTDRMQSVSGVPHPMAFFRIGGPDIGEVVQANKSDLIECNLHFDNVAMALLNQWFPAQSAQVPKVCLSVGAFMMGWTHRKVF